MEGNVSFVKRNNIFGIGLQRAAGKMFYNVLQIHAVSVGLRVGK
jgi:hypothetical protein